MINLNIFNRAKNGKDSSPLTELERFFAEEELTGLKGGQIDRQEDNPDHSDIPPESYSESDDD